MKKSGIVLLFTGALIGVGVILSFYGNYLLFEDLAQTTGVVSMNNDLILEVEIESTKSETGRFAVQIIDFKDQTISVSIIDPLDNTIESKTISEKSYEEVFDLRMTGIYKMVVSNNGDVVNVAVAIGPDPYSDEIKPSIVVVSMIILFCGLIGMAIVAVLIVLNRKRAIS